MCASTSRLSPLWSVCHTAKTPGWLVSLTLENLILLMHPYVGEGENHHHRDSCRSEQSTRSSLLSIRLPLRNGRRAPSRKPRPLLSGEAEELRARGMPLGLMPGMSYEEKQTVLDAGEAALFYSDGLVEAHDPKGDMFSFPRLKALLAKHGEEGSLGEYLMEELYSFVGEGWEQEDDITLLTLRRSAFLS